MELNLTWDLFVIVFTMVVMAYSFIIGRDNILKVTLATYVAVPAADAAGSLIGLWLSGSELSKKILSAAAITNEDEAIILVKVIVFVLLVILLAVKGAFDVRSDEDRSAVMKMISTIIYSILSAGLIISSLLIFVSGISIIGGGSADTTTTVIDDIFVNSQLIRFVAENAYFWFVAPAFAFLLHSLTTSRE